MNANGRRQRQAAMGFTNLCKRQRPNYKKRDSNISAARQAVMMQRERDRRARGAKF